MLVIVPFLCSGSPIGIQRILTNQMNFMTRDTRKHIAFGAGPHFCAGAFASRALVADVALPMIFERLDGLRLDPVEDVVFRGWAFRGPLNVKVLWS